MNSVNAEIRDYNNKVKELNKLAADARREKLQLGTTQGNQVYREWRSKHSGLNALYTAIQQKIAQLSACKSKYCSGTRWQSWVHTRLISGTCTPCISFQEKYNEAAKEYNAVIDKLNALQKKQREYIEQYGESGSGQSGYEDMLEKEDLHGLLKEEREGRAKLDAIQVELKSCVEDKCKTDTALGRDLIHIFGPLFDVEVIDTKNITGNDPYDPRDPIADNNENLQQGGNPVLPTVQVVNNIPISRLTLIGAHPPFCALDHYHGNANNCNGVFTPDPNPGGCGHGTVLDVVTIPVSSCPDL